MSAPSPPSAPYGPPPPAPRRRSTAVVVAVAVVLVVVLVAGSLAAWATWSSFGEDDDGPNAAPPSPSTSATMPSYPAELARFYRQDLDWRSCGANECTRLTVPLDYADPDGKTIKLEVVRVPAARRAQRVGQLVVDPGGPGGSAVEYATAGPNVFGNQLSRYFDIVGMDPRGVGESTPAGVRRHQADRRVRRRRPRPRHPGRGVGLRPGQPRLRPALPGAQRRPDPAHLHGRGRQGHGHPPGRAGGAAARLPGRVVRHPDRRHLRRHVPRQRPPDGPRRRPRPDAEPRAGQRGTGRGLRDRARRRT